MKFHAFRPAWIVILVLALTLTAACSGQITPNLPEPEYAGQITESLLLAVNAVDYGAFSKDFDDSLLTAIPEENFDTQFNEGIRERIGEYSAGSKRFFEASSQAQYTTVVYYAVFTRENGAVQVRISFKMVEGQPLVSGIYFNSPKLRS